MLMEKRMEKITFECETITPMFLAGADGKTPELRPPAIKAAMRFWWRAVNADKPIAQLREEEAKIFGGSDKDANKSQLIIKLSHPDIDPSEKLLPRHEVTAIHKPSLKISILDYLTFGPCSYDRNVHGNVFNRPYIKAGVKFSIKIDFNPKTILKDDIELLVMLIAYVGGIGTKSRNGFGRFKINNITVDKNFEYLINKIKSIAAVESDFTSFSKNTKVYNLNSNGTHIKWDNCLAELGNIYKCSRENLEAKHFYDKRSYIASPIIVGKGPGSLKSFLERHAKSYFLTVVSENNNFNGYILFLPYNYCSNIQNPPLPIKTLKKNYDSVNSTFNSFLAAKMGVLL